MSIQVEHNIKKFIKDNELIQKGDTLLVGVSGGADSMALLHFLYTHKEEYEVTLKVAHVHHGVRKEAEEDAKYVEMICHKWHIPFYRYDCNIRDLARQKKMTEEEVGRQERYNFFISLLNPNDKIVTAHNMNDQAETLIMRFVRGTDLKGLGGIAPKNGIMIRPLLETTRAEIEAYCAAYHIEYKQDATNFIPIYTRNKIRLKVLPYLQEEFNPSIVNTLGRQSELYREEESFLAECVMKNYNSCVQKRNREILLNINQLQKNHPYMQKRIIFKAVQDLLGTTKDITFKHIASIAALINAQNGKEIHLPYDSMASKQYNDIVLNFVQTSKVFDAVELKIGTQRISKFDKKISLSFVNIFGINEKEQKIYTKYIDYGRIKNGLQIRTRLSGDYIKIGNCTKKLNRLFIDDKIPKQDRDTVLLIADGNEIVWVIGGRLNTDYYITEQTSKILEISITSENA